jgi:hypothetical protein
MFADNQNRMFTHPETWRQTRVHQATPWLVPDAEVAVAQIPEVPEMPDSRDMVTKSGKWDAWIEEKLGETGWFDARAELFEFQAGVPLRRRSSTRLLL